MSEWKAIELPEIVKFDTKGDAMEGTYLRTEVIGKGEDAFEVFVFEHEDDNDGLWSTAASAGLAPLMRDIKPGTYCRVSYLDDRDTGQPSPMKVMKVETRG